MPLFVPDVDESAFVLPAATTAALGGVRIDQAPGSGDPIVLTVPRLGAASGVASLDSGTHVPHAQLPADVPLTSVANTFLQNQYVTGDVVVTGLISATLSLTAKDVVVTGLTGATAASRYVGATASGAPVTGAFLVGDFIIDRSGALWICTGAGSPGTWVQGGGALPSDLAYTDVANDFTVTQSIDVGGSDEALDITSFSGTALTVTAVTGISILSVSTSGIAGRFASASNTGLVGVSTTGLGADVGSQQAIALLVEHQGSLIAPTAQPTLKVLRAGVTASSNVYTGPLIFGNDAPTGSAASSGPLVQLQHNTVDAFIVDNLGKLTMVSGSLPSNGQLLIGDGAGFSLASLTAGANVTITPGVGSITLDGAGTTIQTVTTNTVLVAPAIGDLLVKVDQSGVTLDLPLASTMIGRRVYVVADQPGYATTVHTSSGSFDALVRFGAQTPGGGISFIQDEDVDATGAMSQVYLADDTGNWFILLGGLTSAESGGGSGSSTLAADTDVDISSPADGDLLIYQASDGKWHNLAAGAPGTLRWEVMTDNGGNLLVDETGTVIESLMPN